MEIILQTTSLSKHFGRLQAVKQLNLEIAKGFGVRPTWTKREWENEYPRNGFGRTSRYEWHIQLV